MIGAQNAGKSSIIEGLSGIHFPCGEGLCTRCPVTVSLEVDPAIKHPVVVVALDAGFTTQRVEVPLGQERSAIEAAMNALARGRSVVDSAVYVRVVRSSGPVLTITDLPGITAIGTGLATGAGVIAEPEDDDDIEATTVELTRRWCHAENTVVVCVLPALDDFHNSTALRLALEADPRGERTLGVVTKVDLLPTTGDFAEKMNASRASDVKLPGHGFLAVCGKAPSVGATHAERSLFTTHPQLARLHPEQWGLGTLAKRLVHVQSALIRRVLPTVLRSVAARRAAVRSELAAMPPRAMGAEDQQRLLSRTVHTASVRFYDLCMANDCTYIAEMHVAARSHEACHTFAAKIDERIPDFLSDTLRDEIAEQLGETRGVFLPNFIHGSVFRRLMKRHFETPLKEESEALVGAVAAIVKHALSGVLRDALGAASAHERLTERLTAAAHALAMEEHAEALRSTADLVRAEMRSAFTQDDMYARTLARLDQAIFGDGGAAAMLDNGIVFPPQFLERASADCKAERAPGSPNLRAGEAANVRKLQASLHVYKCILLRRTFDTIPMLVRDRLLFTLHDRLASDLLLDPSLFQPSLFEESPHVTERRTETEKLEQRLTFALQKLEMARDE